MKKHETNNFNSNTFIHWEGVSFGDQKAVPKQSSQGKRTIARILETNTDYDSSSDNNNKKSQIREIYSNENEDEII